ncbi:translation initiation factor IF-2 [cyanobiont of Ornithocercus magnificus]|nr:translation initiation factor IF-2 [cyanobiont of Ornithocercus magnificus]
MPERPNASGQRPVAPKQRQAPRPRIVRPQSGDVLPGTSSSSLSSQQQGRTGASPQRPISRPEIVVRPQQPKRPVSPPSRPTSTSPGSQRPGYAPRPTTGSNQRNIPAPQRQTDLQRPASRSGQLRPGSGTLELVGKPIRRDSTNRDPGVTRLGSGGGLSRPGMRKPVAPSELMQLQKPMGRPGVAPPRRPDGSTVVGKRSDAAVAIPPVARPTAPQPPSPPRRPGYRQVPGMRRPGRPDWDDSAKLEALRNRSPQKQRQKVHIIGENDDALAAQTGGYAGEQQNQVLSASLARPAKPKSQRRTTPKPVAAMRKRKKETTRQRQRRRAMELRAAREAKQVRPEMLIVPEDNLTVQELADMLSIESSEIIKSLFFKGIIATVTQSLDLPTIETVAEEFGVPVLQDDVEEAAKKTVEMIGEEDIGHLIRRPPVVTVMGHVDHGKTSLLDAIRKARVAAGEAGGITQHIGAYQVHIEHGGEPRRITFLDTPGHAAFTAMRARGTKVTDIAVLVVAADDGVRPQTLEAISHARAAEVPIVVAINKVDKEGASPDRVKQELSEQNLLAEEWGGDVVMVPVSAIKSENIDKLLEMILLVTEVEDLQANPDRLAKGTVIEAHLDKAKGPVATLLVQNGTLRTSDVVAAGPVLGKVRAMVDDGGHRVKEAGPSCAVEALGFSEVPTAGDEFEVYPDEKSARAVVGDRASDARAIRLAQQMASRRVSLAAISGQASEGELKELNLILKADVQGSVEAILGSLEQLPKDEVQVRVLLSAPGEITETDVDLAAASGAVIIGFNTSMASGAKRAADATGVDVREYEVIYKLLEDIQMAMEGLLEPELVQELLGEAEVRAVFTIGKSAVAGCYVTAGKLQRNCKVRVNRGREVVFTGDLDSLRRNKDDVKEIATGFECGVGCDRFANWEEGDKIEAYKMVTQRRKLST